LTLKTVVLEPWHLFWPKDVSPSHFKLVVISGPNPKEFVRCGVLEMILFGYSRLSIVDLRVIPRI
jgi:hypothetical protein